MNGEGYEVYVVVRDKDYPMPEEPQPWEAGWYLIGTWEPDELDDAEWFADYLAKQGKDTT